MNYLPSKILVEADVQALPYTQKILAKYSNIPIEYVQDVREYIKQNKLTIYNKNTQPLLLAKQRGQFLEKCPGTKEHICCNYYTLNVAVGCPYDCTYCFLQSYTNNPYYTLYMNLEDMLNEVRDKVRGRKIRVGTGEFTDSLALEPQTEFVRTYVPKLLSENPELTLELKTKSGEISVLKEIGFQNQIVLGWSLNSEKISRSDERYSLDVLQRIKLLQKVQDMGYRVGIHFDPIVMTNGWEQDYQDIVNRLSKLDPRKVAWISLGTLRFTPELKPLIEQRFPESTIVYGELFPGKDKKMRYLEPLRIEIYRKMYSWLNSWSANLPIYLCMESPQVWRELFHV